MRRTLGRSRFEASARAVTPQIMMGKPTDHPAAMSHILGNCDQNLGTRFLDIFFRILYLLANTIKIVWHMDCSAATDVRV
jgi:hypothetical protein